MISRRQFLRRAVETGLALGLTPLASVALGAGRREFVVRAPRPQDLETPVQYLNTYLTPNELFFVRSHFGVPAITASRWHLNVGGRVARPGSLSLDQLKQLETVSLPATLQCAGNGRGFFRPQVAGVQWMRGAVGNADWRGVRLAQVLEKFGAAKDAPHVRVRGYDTPPMPTTPSFVRSIPIERATDPTTILAFEMNGQPLPALHGGPLRLIVPGWAGDHWCKWLREIIVQDHEAEGFYMQTGYRMPPTPVQPGQSLKKPEVPVAANPVKSIIARPLEDATLGRGQQIISGVAFTGVGEVTSVAVSVDDGKSWHEARVEPQESFGAWQLWHYQWKAERPGSYVIAARATDSAGRVQPEVTPWNHGGYLWNGIERIRCEVRG